MSKLKLDDTSFLELDDDDFFLLDDEGEAGDSKMLVYVVKRRRKRQIA